jgi:mono/diheme cytochrome c family protein
MRVVGILAVLGLTGLLFACDDMANQPKRLPFEAKSGEAPPPRQLPSDVVARDEAEEPSAAPPVTPALLQRGQERFDIFCAPCHSRTGDGHGMIVERGFPAPPSYHIDRLRQVPVQHFYDVITDGYGAMFSYRTRVEPADRWAIAAYIRALQLADHADVGSLSPKQKEALR